MLLKGLVVKLINKIFGTNLSSTDLDSFFSFINLLIGAFGSQSAAVAYIQRTTAKAKTMSKDQVLASFTGLENTMGQAQPGKSV